MTILAKFDGKVFVPVAPVDLPVGRVVEIDVKPTEEFPPGSPQAILRAMASSPKVSADDVAELKKSIKSGKRPVQYEGIFDKD